MGLSLRPATVDDLPALVRLAQAFRAEVYADVLTDSPSHMEAVGAGLLESPNGGIWVADRDGALVAMIGALVFDHHLSGDRIASEVFWYVVPEERGGPIGLDLLAVVEAWAAIRGARTMQMIAPTRAVGLLYATRGYKLLEYTYARRLDA